MLNDPKHIFCHGNHFVSCTLSTLGFFTEAMVNSTTCGIAVRNFPMVGARTKSFNSLKGTTVLQRTLRSCAHTLPSLMVYFGMILIQDFAILFTKYPTSPIFYGQNGPRGSMAFWLSEILKSTGVAA
jgi:hypothetical protein